MYFLICSFVSSTIVQLLFCKYYEFSFIHFLPQQSFTLSSLKYAQSWKCYTLPKLFSKNLFPRSPPGEHKPRKIGGNANFSISLFCGRDAAAPNFATAVMGCPPHNNVFQAETLVGISFQTPAGRCRRGEFPFCFRRGGRRPG